MGQTITLRPQPGPQEKFLSSPADIAIYGGSAGGGKTYAMLLEPLRHIANPQFNCVVFRRTVPQITNPGAVWDESMKIYPLLGAKPNLSNLKWTFPAGAVVRFAHMQHEEDRLAWQGSQITLICFDELTHFTEAQFLYMLSRNRSMSGIRPYIRATTNPDADSWVKGLLAPWVDPEHSEFPFPAGKLRHFTHQGGAVTWVTGDWRDELGMPAKTITFIPASIFDNKALLAVNPEYLASLRALPFVEQQRLLHGSWTVKAEAGKVFNQAWFEVVEAAPAGGRRVRWWDFAATEKKTKGDDPDWTVGLLYRKVGGLFFVEDVVRVRATPAEVKRLVKNTATQDGIGTKIGFEVEGGSAGQFVKSEMLELLAGFDVVGLHPVTDKLTRAGPVAGQSLAGNVKILRGAWNKVFLAELHGFPDLDHDDQVDGLSGAHNLVVTLVEGRPPAGKAVSREALRDLLG
jgi:predicted phage terminase large subunit-like protein